MHVILLHLIFLCNLYFIKLQQSKICFFFVLYYIFANWKLDFKAA